MALHALLVAAALSVNAAPAGRAPLLAAVDQIRSQRPFSGSLLVVKDGNVLAARSYGYADRARRVRARLDTRYRISGLTVAFTWIGLLQLRDAGRLDLDKSVCAFFHPCPHGWRRLTPRHLMDGSSGLKRLSSSDFARRPPTLSEYVERLRRERLYFVPGTLVAHNTSPYYGGGSPELLAARLLEVASGQHWSDYVRRRIFRPAGMNSTGLTRSARDAVGYGRRRDGGIVERPLPQPTVVPPVDLGMWSTVRDFARLDRALSSGRLLSQESLAELDTPVLERDRRRGRGWGCCWAMTKRFGHMAEIHGAHGFGDGFYAAFERFPADGAVVLLFTNYGGSGPAFAVAELAASIALGEYPTAVEVDLVALRRLTGVFELTQRRGKRVFHARLAIAVQNGALRVTKTSPGFDELRGPLLAISDGTFAAKYAPGLRFEFAGDELVVRHVDDGWRLDFRRVG